MFPTEEELGGMAAAGPDPARAMEVARTMMVMRVGRLDFEPAFDLAQVLIEDMDGEDQTIERPLVEALLARAGDRPHDPRRRALLMRLGEIQTEAGDFAGGIASYRAAGAADGTCLIAHNGVAFAGGEISSDSYPDWAARYGAAGRTTIEFGIDAQGRVANQRVIFSAPGGLFDGVATEAFGASARYLPRREGARPRSCGGNMVTIHWRMADEEEEEGEEKVVDFDPFAPDSI
jgi:hypothetical protein